jgi:hypothetical protein
VDPEEVIAVRASQDALSRKMRGLKKKRRKFTRGLSPRAPSGGNQKDSSFDFAAYRELNDNLPALNAQQIRAATAPAKARSPLSKVKRDRRAFKASLEASISKQRRLQWTAERQQKKIADLKGRNNQLLQDILQERRVSNKIIDEAMSDARKLSTEALEMMREANLQVIKDDERIISERNRASAKIQEERLFQARESDRLKRQFGVTINKLHCEQEASIKLLTAKSNKKYQDVRIKMIAVSTKLKDQQIIWQKRLSDVDASSKKQISNERERRRCSIQQQLDKSSAVEDQFMEIINGLEEMNDELAEEVKSAKKDRRVALKLYDKSKDASKKRLNKLQLEKEEKNVLKDELTQAFKIHVSLQNEIARLLIMQQAPQQVIEEYKSMIDGFKSSKLKLKREVKLGRRGGASWPLWVTEVCCELLVNGSPPSAIPSTIGTLFAMLYSEEPTSIPSLDYVRQCRVLVQIVSETITAMKLSICTNWAEIFFDATTRRQVPFSAVVISLMGDTPESIDPVIVSSCVVLEDETSETQVDGIISKVRHIIILCLLTVAPKC